MWRSEYRAELISDKKQIPPKLERLVENLRILKESTNNFQKISAGRGAVYSNFVDICADASTLLNDLFPPGVVLRLHPDNFLKTLDTWHSRCPKCKFLNPMRRTGLVCAKCNEQLPYDQQAPFIIVIDSQYREGIDLFWVTEMHLLDSCASFADLTQVKARVARTQDPCKVDMGLQEDTVSCEAPRKPLPRKPLVNGGQSCCAVLVKYIHYSCVASVSMQNLMGFMSGAMGAATQTTSIIPPRELWWQTLSYDGLLTQGCKEAFEAQLSFLNQINATPRESTTFADTYTCAFSSTPANTFTKEAPAMSETSVWGDRTPLTHQNEALEVFVRTLEARHKEMLLMHGAGTGKTLTSMACIKTYAKRNGTYAIVVPTEGLKEQWVKEYGAIREQIFLYTEMASLVGRLGNAKGTIVVCDEAHYLLTLPRARAELFSKASNDDFILMVTATPILTNFSNIETLIGRSVRDRQIGDVRRDATPITQKVVHTGSIWARYIAQNIIQLLIVYCVVRMSSLVLVQSGVNVDSEIGNPSMETNTFSIWNTAAKSISDATTLGLYNAKNQISLQVSWDTVADSIKSVSEGMKQIPTDALSTSWIDSNLISSINKWGTATLIRAMKNAGVTTAKETVQEMPTDVLTSIPPATIASANLLMHDNALAEDMRQRFTKNLSQDLTTNASNDLMKLHAAITEVAPNQELVSVSIGGISTDMFKIGAVWLVIFATMTALRWMTTDVSVTKAIEHFVSKNLYTVNHELVRTHAYYSSGNLCMMPVAEMDDYESGKVDYTRKQMDVLVRFSSRVRASTAIDQANNAWLTFLERNAPTVSQQGVRIGYYMETVS